MQLYLAVATETRGTEYNTGNDEWVKSSGWIVLGTVYASDYDGALQEISRLYNIVEDNVDAYTLEG